MISLSALVKQNDCKGVASFLGKHGLQSKLVEEACRDAIQLGLIPMVELFLEKGLKVDSLVNESEKSSKLVYLKVIAVRVGNLAMVELLVNRGAIILDTPSFDGWGVSSYNSQEALRAAVGEHQVPIVRYLLGKGANAKADFTWMPKQSLLAKAALDGQEEIVGLLVEHGAKNIEHILSENHQKFAFSSLEMNIRYYDGLSLDTYYSESTKNDFIKKKVELIRKRDSLLQEYSVFVRILLDHAMGANFTEDNIGIPPWNKFLKELDITGFNFIGVLVDGKQVTPEMLTGIKGAEKALLTEKDIQELKDQIRKEQLMSRVSAYKLQTEKITIDTNAKNS